MRAKLILLSIPLLSVVIIGSGTVFLLMQQPVENNEVLLDTSFSLKIGESANLSEHGILISFTDVLADSRCPKDVVCFWEGTVSLALNIVFENSNLGEYILNLSNLHKASFLGYYVKLLTLEPYPISTEPIHKADYVGTFIVSEYGED